MFNKFLGEAKGIFNVITLIQFVSSLIYIVLGLIFFSNPDISNLVVSIITGIVLVGNGIVSIYSYIKRSNIDLFNNDLVFGIILIIVGILAMILGKSLQIILGIYFIISGAQKINYGVFLKKFNESSWLLILVVGIMFMVLGITAFFTSGEKIISVTGICLLGYGLMNLINVILLRKRSSYFIA